MEISWSLTPLTAFLEGNSKIGLWKAVDHVPYYHNNHQFWAPRKNGRGDTRRKVQFSAIFQLQKPRDLDLNLGWGQGHIGMHNTCRPSSVPNRVTVASRSIEIWPFEIREISRYGEFWTPLIATLDGNWKIGLKQAADQVPYYHSQPSLLSPTQKWWKRHT